MGRVVAFVALALATAVGRAESPPAELQHLASDFWSWRAHYAPFTGDDVNRMERPGGLRNWSRAAIEQRKGDLSGFESRWKNIESSDWAIPHQVDKALIGSALARVHWELEVNPRWKRDPKFLPRTNPHRARRSADGSRSI